MWTITDVKMRGKAAFKANYWKCVLVGLISSAVLGSGGSSGIGSIDGSEGSIDIAGALGGASSAIGISPLALITLILGALGIGLIIYLAIAAFAIWPLQVGCKSFFLQNIYSDCSLALLGDGFRKSYLRNVLAMFIVNILIAVGYVVLIIPGIVLGYMFRMVPYILIENPEMTAAEAIKRSIEMMKGNKWRTFLLDLSFIGWAILTVITCGLVGLFYYIPYALSTDAALYVTIKYRGYEFY